MRTSHAEGTHNYKLISREYTGRKPEIYKRYIDDIFCATSISRDELDNYVDFVKNFHPALKFTYEILEQVSFLDVSFSIKDKLINSTVHYKSTDTHSYLLYSSEHPKKCKEAIPFSQFLRLKHLCSDTDDFKEKCANMEDFFLSREYPRKVQRPCDFKLC